MVEWEWDYPMPGIKWPESLTFARRFSPDSARSEISEKKDKIVATVNDACRENSVVFKNNPCKDGEKERSQLSPRMFS